MGIKLIFVTQIPLALLLSIIVAKFIVVRYVAVSRIRSVGSVEGPSAAHATAKANVNMCLDGEVNGGRTEDREWQEVISLRRDRACWVRVRAQSRFGVKSCSCDLLIMEKEKKKKKKELSLAKPNEKKCIYDLILYCGEELIPSDHPGIYLLSYFQSARFYDILSAL